MAERDVRVGPDNWDEAVSNDGGYQMVVAGPGTGKTEFLVRRVGHLVSSGRARRDAIAVLCFSRRASADLSRRIDDLIGATGVPLDVTTFHSLALRIIEASTDGDRPTPLTTPEQVGLVHRILREEVADDWPLTYRGILGSPAFAGEVADFLMRCSERLLTPDDLAERASGRADWRALPALYGKYLATLTAEGRIDYGTLLTSAVDLLRSPDGRTQVRHFEYVLVDEYQDTSRAQATMADLIAKPSGNLTVAGDPYQSIYSFRGAELRNVADFTERHHESTRLVLEKSFRVPAEIMRSALQVVSGGELPGSAGPVEPADHAGRVDTYVFDQETAEAEWIAREVEHAIRVEGVAPEAIAVLVRSKKEMLNELSRSLSRRSIPHDPPDSRLIDHPAVRLIEDLAIVATQGMALPHATPSEAQEADRAMRRILLGPSVGLSLGRERDVFRHRRRTWAAWDHVIAETLASHPGLRELLADQQWATTLPAIDGFWHAWTTMTGLGPLIDDPRFSEWRRAWSSFAQVLARQHERDPGLDLRTFFELSSDDGFEATPLLSLREVDQRVVLTTLHQAKGLEFDIVFIANAVEGVFPDLRRSRRMLRPELLSPERTSDAEAQHLFQIQEEMRLAYTAMTRARLRVVWTATDAGVDQGERRPSRFIAAASDGEQHLAAPPDEQRPPVTVAEAETELRRVLSDPTKSPVARIAAAQVLVRPPADFWSTDVFAGVPEPGADKPLLRSPIRISPSQAQSYELCPRRYALERRLRLGDSDSPYAQFGTLVHEALERAERTVLGQKRTHAGLDVALAKLDECWKDADFGTPELNSAWLVKARETITHLYEEWPHVNGTPANLELKVTSEIEGVEWIGFVDRLEQTDEGYRVVDYKTSSSAMTQEEAGSSVQLGFYSMCVQDDLGTVAQAQLWYPRVNSKSVTTRDFDLRNLDDVREELAAITRSILDEDWEPRVGDHCERCSFRLSCPAWPEGKGAFLP